MKSYDLIIIGGGISGLNCGINSYDKGIENILIIEKDNMLGGSLKGTSEFKNYVNSVVEKVNNRKIDVKLNTMVLSINNEGKVVATSKEDGIEEIASKNIIICNGNKEKGKNTLNLTGDRCSGIYTVNMADKILDMEDVHLGESILIYGTENLFKIKEKLENKKVNVSAIVSSNFNDDIFELSNHILFNYKIKSVNGDGRIESVTLDNGDCKKVACDTLIIAEGVVPDGIIGMRSAINLNPKSGGILVDDNCKTSREHIYACGDCIGIKRDISEVTSECINVINNLNK